MRSLPPFAPITGKATPDGGLAERLKIEKKALHDLIAALRAQLEAALPADMAESAVEAVSVGLRMEAAGGPVRDAVQRLLLNASVAGINHGQEYLLADLGGIGIDWALANTAASQWVQRYGFDLVRGINATSRTALQTHISRWVENGEPLSRLTADLEPTFGAQRAESIASTEVTRAYAEGNVEAWLASPIADRRPEKAPPGHPRCRCWITLQLRDGVWCYVWNTANDEIVKRCPICWPLHNQSIGVASDDNGNGQGSG